MPQGYVVVGVFTDHLIVGMTDFLLMFEDAVPSLTYNGQNYVRGLLEPVPHEWVGHVCSMRRYDLTPA